MFYRSERGSRLGHTAISTLRHRDFRLLWLGQLVSMIGDQMQSVAIGWHVFILTDSTLHVGMVGLARALPLMALSFAGGTMADLVSRKRVMLGANGVMMMATMVLVISTATGTVTPWVIYLVSLVSGATIAFESPARQAIVPNLVPRAELANALTLNSILRHTANVAGPGIGGVVVGFLGLSTAYGINAASFLAVIGALLLMGPVSGSRRESSGRWDAVLGGLRYARSEPLVLRPMLLDFVVTCLRSYRPLLPVFARDILVVGPEGLGLLHSASAAGALMGGVLLGAVGPLKRAVTFMLLAYAAEGVFVMGFGISPSFALSLLVLCGYGMADVVSEVLRSTIVQLNTPDDVRGRVSALGSMFEQGGPQLGQLQMGATASIVGPIPAAVIGGMATVLAVAGFALWLPVGRQRRTS